MSMQRIGSYMFMTMTLSVGICGVVVGLYEVFLLNKFAGFCLLWLTVSLSLIFWPRNVVSKVKYER